MQIVDKAKALGSSAVDKLAAKRDAVTETVSEIIDRGKEAAHHLVDKVSAVVHGAPSAEASAAPAPAALPRVTKQPGHKKPRAERRRARRLARAQA